MIKVFWLGLRLLSLEAALGAAAGVLVSTVKGDSGHFGLQSTDSLYSPDAPL
jgi:hypothetical protein